MPKLKLYGKYDESGKLSFVNAKRYEQDKKAFIGRDVEILIKDRGKRTSQTNRYYWGVLVEEIRIELHRRGNQMDGEQVHEFLKFHFNKKYIHDEHGEVLTEYGGSTADMNQEEMSEYMEKIIRWAAEKLQITIGAPGEQTDLFNHQAA